jgi:methyl-accepting chemotaxis protein
VRAEPGAEALGAVVIAMSDEQALAAVRSDKLLVLAVALGLFAVMTAGTLVVLGRLLGRPLETLGGAVNRLEQGDYDTPVPMAGRQDELGAIARDLDRLAAVLRKGREGEAQREAQHEAQVKVVNSLGAGLDALARGVLTTRLAETFPGDYEALRDNFNRAVTSLAEAIAAVQGNAHSISNGANEIAQSSDDLSRRTETQAATLEQTAAALEELLASVRSAAQNAEDADTAVGEARDMANRNDDVMRSAMKAMAEIERSSEQIGEIITVIDDIAFQTNLLALNAGVEAARAGSSGKGFAVVASEVRALAQRSSDAARQIKDLISGSTDQVKQGARLVEEAGAALEQVVNRVSAVSDLVSGIAAGASEQSQGLNEINVGVANLDQVTQQNAAMVEQSTAAAHMLRGEAAELTALVARFEIDEGPGVNDGRDSAGGQVSAA